MATQETLTLLIKVRILVGQPMSRSRKNHLYWNPPRGRRKALLNNCRHKAIPPDSWWADLPKEAHEPYHMARLMFADGYPFKWTVKRVQERFEFTYLEAVDIVERAYKILSWSGGNVKLEFIRIKEEIEYCRIWKKKRIKKNKYRQSP